MISAKINVLKIDKNRLFKGSAGTYLDIVLIPHRQGRDQYGQDGFVAENLSKEERESGAKGSILGYYKQSDRQAAKPDTEQKQQKAPAALTDDIPF